MSELLHRSLDMSLIDIDTIREHFSYLYLFGNACVGKYQIRNDKSGVLYIYKDGVSMSLGGKNLLFRIKNQDHYLNVLDYEDMAAVDITTDGAMYSVVTRQQSLVCGIMIMNIYHDFMGDLPSQASCCMLLTNKDFIRYTRG